MDVTDQFYVFSERYCRADMVGRCFLVLAFMYLGHFWGRVWMNIVTACYIGLVVVVAIRYDDQLPMFLQGLVWGIVILGVFLLLLYVLGKRRS